MFLWEKEAVYWSAYQMPVYLGTTAWSMTWTRKKPQRDNNLVNINASETITCLFKLFMSCLYCYIKERRTTKQENIKWHERVAKMYADLARCSCPGVVESISSEGTCWYPGLPLFYVLFLFQKLSFTHCMSMFLQVCNALMGSQFHE